MFEISSKFLVLPKEKEYQSIRTAVNELLHKVLIES
jgi:hypothetical protein